MTDDVMKKVESLLFDEDEKEDIPELEEDAPELETSYKEEIPELKKEEKVEEQKGSKEKEVFDFEKVPERKFSMKDFVEIFFDGRMEINGAKIKPTPGSEVEAGNVKFVFEDASVKVYEI